MRLGCLVRCDHRGLAIQSGEFFRHMDPAASLVVTMGQFTPYEERPQLYLDQPNTMHAPFAGGQLPEEAIDWLLERCDVVWSAETFYDPRLVIKARERGVKTVQMANFEFLRVLVDPSLPPPDLYLAPSPWHLDDWPEPVVYMPFPVARDRLPFRLRTKAETFLHVAGHRAMQDRNGTRLFTQALGYLRADVKIIIRSQSAVGPLRRYARHSNIEVIEADIDNYWDLYAGADVLVAPRRFGGQSLPMHEAASCGMPVISLDVEPQRRFLPSESLIPTRRSRLIRCQSGAVECHDTDPHLIASKINELAGDDALVERLSKEADQFAESISWDRMRGEYLDLFGAL